VRPLPLRKARTLRFAGILVAALLVSTTSTIVITPPANGQTPPPIRWLAAGDSYASGQGLLHLASTCGRAVAPSRAWATVSYDKLHQMGVPVAEPKLVACSGAKTNEFFTQQGVGNPAEWNPSMGRFGLITISFGGNDVGFDKILKKCIAPELTTGSLCSESYVRDQVGALAQSYPSFLENVAKAATTQGGNVVVMGYPELIELPKLWPIVNQLNQSCQGVSANDANLLRGWAGALNAALGNAVAAANKSQSADRRGATFTFVDPVSGSNGVSPADPNLFEPTTGIRHELCSGGDASWLNGVSFAVKISLDLKKIVSVKPTSLHPTQPGTNAMGNLAASAIFKLGLTASKGSGDITIYTAPSIIDPGSITAGPDGAMWFTNVGGRPGGSPGSIGRISVGGVITNYADTSINAPFGITAGPDGALWFTNTGSNSIGRITTAGVITNYTDRSIIDPGSITAGPDGALWFTESNPPGQGAIGRITTAGVVTNYTDRSIASPNEITSGPDGALWFTDDANSNTGVPSSIGRITTTGVVTSYPRPNTSNTPLGITPGQDGALWFSDGGVGCVIGRIATNGVVTNYTESSAGITPQSITHGSDEALWFGTDFSHSIGRLTTSGEFTIYTDARIGNVSGIAAGLDDAIWFTNTSNESSVASSIGRIAVGSRSNTSVSSR
jgi:virginiamycin B lyase